MADELKGARAALVAGRYREFAERALRLEAATPSWSGVPGPAIRRESAALLTMMAHVSAVRDRLLALRGGGDGGYRADGAPSTAPRPRLRREA